MAEYSLDTIRHSTAHLMAQAISRLWPDENPQFGVGPVIEHGFYYDVKMNHKLTEADLKEIEKLMKKIIKKEKFEVEREVMPKDDALKFFGDQGQELKIELINSFAEGEEISCYRQGEFIDLCRGPHVENIGHLPTSFKLLSVAGAYWRGDEKNEMLQRVYAASFSTKEELADHLKMLEEAKKRDHRKLGKELGLFIFDQVAPASPFFMPKGAHLYNELVDFMRRIYKIYDYKEVITPQILDSELWHTSGHYDHYKENMYFSEIDERQYAVKPMNCPCHMLMFRSHKYSYRDLPLRFADFGRLHRYEKAGAVAGLTRVRTFCQDDAHIFIDLEEIQSEIAKLMEMFFICYKHFGFTNIKINLSTRPEDKAGDDKTWDIAEDSLKQALEKSGHEFFIKEGDGAFYGPKIDVEIADALGRFFQLGTIQLDFQLPERFGLKYTSADGNEKQPVVIHRALLGSLERFIGIYIEHTGGAFPFWLAPEQAVLIPVNNDNHLEYAKEVFELFNSKGFRVRLDDRNESLGYKTRQTQKGKIPFMIVIGDREMENKSLSIRAYGEMKAEDKPLNDVVTEFENLASMNMPVEFKR